MPIMLEQMVGSRPILNTQVFSWVFLVDWIMTGVVILFVIFYFNRLVGWFLSSIFKWHLWRRYHVEIKVESLQLALLGGRVFFKNFVYVGHNESITILQGSLTWRYWLYRWRHSQLDEDQGIHLRDKQQGYETRLNLHVNGLEWFVYNRTPAYDAVLESILQRDNNSKSSTSAQSEEKTSEKDTIPPQLSPTANDQRSIHHTFASSGGLSSRSSASSLSPIDKSFFMHLLPIMVECNKGAVVIGNKDTPHLLVFHIASGTSTIDMCRSKSKLDQFKIEFRTNVVKPLLEFKPNMDYVKAEPFPTQPTFNVTGDESKKKKHCLNPFEWLIWPLLLIRLLLRHRKQEPEVLPDRSNWWGFTRYHVNAGDGQHTDNRDDTVPDELEEEYGKYSILLDAPEATIVYYYDVPGTVPANPCPTREEDGPEVGNGGAPPEWGVDLIFDECTIHYGPWADRQRIPLQEMLLPRNANDALPERKRIKGEPRIYTIFNVNMKFKDNLIWRIPTRESSKNNQFYAQFRENHQLHPFRPFGWIELKAQSDSTISFIGSLVSDSDGWRNEVLFNLERAQLRSSVNHGLLFEADNHILKAAIKNPLKWNGCQQWDMANYSRDVKTFFLREHITLLSDVLTDFSEGPPIPYNLFTPYYIDITWEILEYGIFLNVNDLNIINNPSDFDDNIFVSFQGQKLFIDVHVPMEQVAVIKNKIDFSLRSPRFDLVVDAPPWHTVENFLDSSGTGRAYDFDLKGTYTYYKDVADCNTDQIVLEATGSHATLILYGFVLKDIIKIRENYFGLTTHFQTLEEYTTNPRSMDVTFEHSKACSRTYSVNGKSNKVDNDLDLMLFVSVKSGTILLPANIYGAEENVRLDFATLDIDVRFTNYYMANTSPIRGKYNQFIENDKILDMSRFHSDFEPEIFLEGLVICGNRLFGLPPSEPTYFCKWDFNLGDTLLNGPLKLIEVLGRAVQCLAYNFEDSENAVLLTEPPLYDVTFVTLKISSIKFQFNTKSCALELVTSTLAFAFNDLANDRYSGRVSLELPLARLSILGETDDSGNKPVIASFKTSVMLTDFIQKRHCQERRGLQQAHIAKHDAPFKRCSFLLTEKERNSFEYLSNGNQGPYPSIPLNSVPPPITRESLKFIDPNVNEKVILRNGEDESSLSSKSRISSSLFDTDFSSLSGVGWRSPRAERVPGFDSYKENEMENVSNDYLPPHKWRLFPAISKEFRFVDTDFDLRPTCHYSSEEAILPRNPIDENREYDNLIVQLGAIEGFVSPPALTATKLILETVETGNLEATIDRLQLKLLKRLRLRHSFSIEPCVVNIRAIIPSVNVKYASEVQVRQNMEADLNSFENHIYVDCRGINFVMRLSDDASISVDELMRMETVPTQKIIYFDIDNLSFGIRRDDLIQKSQEYNPMIFQLDKSEFWWYEGQESFGSLRVKSIDLFIMKNQVDWLGRFLDSSISQVMELLRDEDISSKKYQHKLEYAIYQLSLAGELYKIEHDPSVLTRPSYVIQSPLHVRASNSWKLLVRLRHILRSVPDAWKSEQSKILSSNKFDLPNDVRDRVRKLLCKWRSWEMSSIEDTYFFKYAFLRSSLREHIISITTHSTLDIESIGLRLQYAEDEDYLCFDYIKLLVSWKASSHFISSQELLGKKSGLLSVDSTLSCSNVRSRLSHNLLEVADRLSAFAMSSALSSRSRSAPALRRDINDFSATSKNDPTLGVCFNMVLRDISIVVLTPSLETEIAGSDTKMAILAEQLDRQDRDNIIFTMVSTFRKFGVRFQDRQNSNEVARSSVIGAECSVTFKGRPDSCPKNVNIHADELFGSVMNDLTETLNLFCRLLDIEYHLFQRYLVEKAQIDDVKADSEGSKVVDVPFYGPLFVKLSSDITALNFKLLPSLLLLYQTKSSELQLVHGSLDSIFAAIEVGGQTINLKLVGEANSQSLVRGSLSNLTAIGRAGLNGLDIEPTPLELVASLEKLEVKTSTVIHNLANVVNKLSLQFVPVESMIQDLTDRFTEMQGSIPENQKSSNSVRHKIRFDVRRYSIHIPFIDEVVALEGEGPWLESSCFDWKTGQVETAPMKFGISTSLLQLYLYSISSESYSAPFLGLQGSILFNENIESGKNLYEIRSDFTKVLLYPEVISRLHRVALSFSGELELINCGKEAVAKVEPWKEPYDPVRNFMDKIIIRMVVKDFAIAWVFNDPLVNGDGLIFGYQLLEITTESSAARMKLSDVYLTCSVSDKIFLTEKCGVETPNTAILPNIGLNLKYTWKPQPLVSLRLFGESLRVTLLPSVVGTIAGLIKSLDRLSQLEDEQFHSISSSPSHIRDMEPSSIVPAKPNAFQLPFSLKLSLEFEAAMITLWDDENFEQNAAERAKTSANAPKYGQKDMNVSLDLSALSLQTPGIKASVAYDRGEKLLQDNLNMEILITSSSNTIFPKAVPVAFQLIQTVNDAMRERHQSKSSQQHAPIQPQDVDTLFANLDVNFGLRFEKQELSLSCLPTAKVAATVSIGNSAIGVNTIRDDVNGHYVCVTANVSQLRAFLQHIYSREYSCSFRANEIILVGAKGNISSDLEPVRISGKMSKLSFELNTKQMQDLELFQDIWMPSGSLREPDKEATKREDNNEGLARKYRKVSTTLAIPWSVDLAVLEVTGDVNLGSSVGKVKVSLDKFWMSSRKSSSWEHNLSLEFHTFLLQCQGRLGGKLQLQKFRTRTAILWQGGGDQQGVLSIPLIQLIIGLDLCEAKVSLDYHYFALASILGLNVSMSNQRDRFGILQDRLFTVGECNAFNVYLTGLAASKFLDIYYILKRIRLDSNVSYDAILQDSSKDTVTQKMEKVNGDKRKPLDTLMARLRTTLDIQLDSFEILVFPTDFSDSVVLGGHIDNAFVKYSQEQRENHMHSTLRLKMTAFGVALSTIKKPFLDDIGLSPLASFTSFVGEHVKGGTIIHVPVFVISMDTWQKVGTNIVEYEFNSYLGGRVDIGWNLGSINIIREMWESHARAFAARKEQYALPFRDNVLTSMKLDENLEDVRLDSSYSYIAREPPIIATPQLRDMGEATPPIEWIGLHRQRLPGLTHQIVILGLQSLAKDVDLLYTRVLGHS